MVPIPNVVLGTSEDHLVARAVDIVVLFIGPTTVLRDHSKVERVGLEDSKHNVDLRLRVLI